MKIGDTSDVLIHFIPDKEPKFLVIEKEVKA